MIVPVDKYDIRPFAPWGFTVVEMGCTEVNFYGRSPELDQTPFSDGAHAKRDGAVLGLQCWVVVGENATLVDFEAQRQKNLA